MKKRKPLTGAQLREKLGKAAHKYIGRPYRYGSKLHHAPNYFDCSSFIKFIYRKIGVDLTRPSIRMAEEGRAVSKKPLVLQAGDLLYFRGMQGRYNKKFPQGIGHVAMYVGEGKVVHAKWHRQGGKVTEESVKKLLSRKDLVIIKRII